MFLEGDQVNLGDLITMISVFMGHNPGSIGEHHCLRSEGKGVVYKEQTIDSWNLME